jgi:hypothetical protein
VSAPGHETHDAPPRWALLGLGVLLAGLLTALGLAAIFLTVFDRAAGPAVAIAPSHPPAPRLEVIGGSDLAQVEARGQRRLDGSLPIEQAMAIVAERGWADPEPRP